MYRLTGIKEYRYRVTVLEGLGYDEVTDIFVRINSGGTRLSNADLSLAQISSRWRGVTEELINSSKRPKRLAGNWMTRSCYGYSPLSLPIRLP